METVFSEEWRLNSADGQKNVRSLKQDSSRKMICVQTVQIDDLSCLNISDMLLLHVHVHVHVQSCGEE